MKVSKEKWQNAMNNLMERRKNGYNLKNSESNPAGNYKLHLQKCKVGKSVLDVGCGFMVIKDFIPKDVIYTGIDAFPSKEGAIKLKIEEVDFKDNSFETIICFAVLDGVNDFDLAMKNINRLASKNIIILTGVNIDVDKYHTFKLTEKDIDTRLTRFKKTYREELGSDKVLLLEYSIL